MHPDAQVISLNVPAGSASLAEVRSSIERLDDLDRETKATVKLLVTELVANSVRHARLDPSETVVVTLEIRPERVRAEVVDWGSGFAMPDDKAPKGRGFAIVQALSSRFGLRRNTETRAWFEIDLPAN
jgi:two-component sensor histidine kinase